MSKKCNCCESGIDGAKAVYFPEYVRAPRSGASAASELLHSVAGICSNLVYDREEDEPNEPGTCASIFNVIYNCERLLEMYGEDDRRAGLEKVIDILSDKEEDRKAISGIIDILLG